MLIIRNEGIVCDPYAIQRLYDSQDALGDVTICLTQYANIGYCKLEIPGRADDKTKIASHHNLYRFSFDVWNSLWARKVPNRNF